MTLKDFYAEWNNGSDRILVHTSGSTGKPKPMMIEKSKMEVSATITCDFLNLKQGDTALLCMPLDYIAGKMVVVRSIVRGLRLISVKPSGHPLRGLTEPPVFAAMIPMQVFNSMQVPEEKEMLMQIKHLIIGGGAIDTAMERELRDFPNSVWSTYGMTETLSHIALRQLNGSKASCWYTPFEGVDVSVNDNGCLIIDAPRISDIRIVTNDIAEIAPDGRRFGIMGRMDNVIDSGGIKIQIEEVETLLGKYLTVPYVITKKSDYKFGEIVAMLVESDDVEGIKRICEDNLPKYWQPKLYISVKKIPRTQTGKPARKQAAEIAKCMI